MIRKYLPVILATLLFAGSLLLRVQELADRAPFDWDQNRDYGEVKKISQGDLVILGPVAKGTGGFFLGSLYYYLLYPGYKLSGGDLASLPLTSVILDSFVPAAIFLIFRKKWGEVKSLASAVLWSFSWFLIEASHVSWNVALVPLWSAFSLYAYSSFLKKPNAKLLYTLAFLTGLAFHIHVSAIPVIPILLVFSFRKLHFPVRTWLIAMGVGLIPVLPLIAHDLTHSFINIRLAKGLFSGAAKAEFRPLLMVMTAVSKFGKVFFGLIFTRYRESLVLGLACILAAIWSQGQKNLLIQAAGRFSLLSITLVILFHDLGFPEYYFSVSYLPMIILFTELIFLAFSLLKKYSWYGVIGVFAYLIFLNLSAHFVPVPPSYNLGAKQAIVRDLKALGKPLDVRYALTPGRDGGFGYLLEREGIEVRAGSAYRAVITDNLDYPAYVDGELAVDRLRVGFFKSALEVVE